MVSVPSESYRAWAGIQQPILGQASWVTPHWLAPKVVKVACIGDSITEGFDGALASLVWASYPTQLAMMLGSGFEVRNYGKSCTLMQRHSWMPWVGAPTPLGVGQRVASVLAYGPDIVTIMLGTNDTLDIFWSKERFIADYLQTVQELRASGGSVPKVFVVIPPCVVPGGSAVAHNMEVVNEELPLILASIAQQLGVEVIDARSCVMESMMPDGVHPDQAGFTAIAAAIAQSIQQHQQPNWTVASSAVRCMVPGFVGMPLALQQV